MADQTHDYGELWGKVENLETNFGKLGEQIKDNAAASERGFSNIAGLIRDNQDKTDKRIDSLVRDTNARFDATSNDYRQSAAARTATALQVIGYLLTALFGIGGFLTAFGTLAFTFYTLSKAPIDAAFARTDQQFAEIKSKQEEIEKKFVPSAQIAGIDDRQKLVIAEQVEHTKSLATMKADVDNLQKQVDRNSVRWDNYIDKLTATPAFPCIGDNCARPAVQPHVDTVPSNGAAH